MDKDQQLEQFVDSFHAIFRYMKRNQWNKQGSQTVTRTQWFILRNLGQNERCTIGQLAEWLEVRPSTMTQMIDRMEAAGFVYREADIRDARTRIVHLTDAGHGMIREMKNARVEVLAEPYNQLTPLEQQTLAALMDKLSRRLPNKV